MTHEDTSDHALDGPERWADVPGWNTRVSSHGRVMTISTGRIQQAKRWGGRMRYVIFNCDTKTYRSVSFHWLVRTAAGVPPPPMPVWTEEEDAILKANTPARAHQLLPHRSSGAIRLRRHQCGFSKKRGGPRGVQPMSFDAWRAAAERIVPRRWQFYADAVGDMTVMHLEGFDGTPAEAFKAVREKWGRERLYGRARSLDAALNENGQTLLDILAAPEQERLEA